MKILHLCLANFYIDGYAYQENFLPRVNKEDGHDVRILASTETFVDNTRLGYVKPSEYVTEYGVPIKRLPYKKVLTDFITHKFRAYPHLYEEISSFAPDVIMCHDIAFWSVLDVVRYKKAHPTVKLYADTHTAAYNSGTSWLSLHMLHRVFYRYLIRKALPYLERYFYITEASRQFSIQNYGVSASLMEFYPLGGTILPEEEYQAVRVRRRAELELAENTLLLVHSGKLDSLKRTDELLRAFAAVPELNAKLVVIGSIPGDRKSLLASLVEADKRVVYLGWKSGEELEEYLCACDLYCQPGSVSATLQNAVCCGCPVLSYPHEDYTRDLDYGNFIWTETEGDIASAFRRIQEDPALLEPLREGSRCCARELLDYRKLAARLYQDTAEENGTKETKEDKWMSGNRLSMWAPYKSRDKKFTPPRW